MQPHSPSGYTRDCWRPGLCGQANLFVAPARSAALSVFFTTYLCYFLSKEISSTSKCPARKLRIFLHAQTCTWIFTEARLTTAKTWDQPKRASQDEGITNMVTGFSFRDKGSTEPTTTWTGLEDVHTKAEEVDTKDACPIEKKCLE